jgi:hypothetical protein
VASITRLRHAALSIISSSALLRLCQAQHKRKNWLFAGSKGGGDATGILLSLVQTCRVMDIDPFVYIEDVLRRINGHPAHRLDELLPGNWHKAESYY